MNVLHLAAALVKVLKKKSKVAVERLDEDGCKGIYGWNVFLGRGNVLIAC